MTSRGNYTSRRLPNLLELEDLAASATAPAVRQRLHMEAAGVMEVPGIGRVFTRASASGIPVVLRDIYVDGRDAFVRAAAEYGDDAVGRWLGRIAWRALQRREAERDHARLWECQDCDFRTAHAHDAGRHQASGHTVRRATPAKPATRVGAR